MERGARVADRYELLERLGRGGMGEVWRGRDRELHRDVAVKILATDDDTGPDLLHRFEREAIAAAQINHPNVVSLYDRGVHDGLRFLVMEHVDGVSLGSHLQQHAPYPLERALRITGEICSALVASHRAAVVHYDIKPSNVMLTADGRVKVVDFGIAGFSHTHTFTVVPTTELPPVGTALYGAPEQFTEDRGDHRSDLYALGGVLFALLAGEPPFTEGNQLSVIRRKLDGEPRRLRDLRPDVPGVVEQLVADLLQREPGRRPQTATEVHERLRSIGRVHGGAAGGTDEEAGTERLQPPATTREFTETAAIAGSRTGVLAGSGAKEGSRPGGRAAGDVVDAGGEFAATWSGREPISSYVTYPRRRPPKWHWSLLTVLVIGSFGQLVPITVMLSQACGCLTSDGWVFATIAVVTIPPTVVYAQWLVRRSRAWRKHDSYIDNRRPWSLRIGSQGITTTDRGSSSPLGGPVGRRRYPWAQVASCTLGYVTEFPGGPRYGALKVRMAPAAPPDNAPDTAGLSHWRPSRTAKEQRPLCVLGPMTERQHQQLIDALDRYASDR